MTCAVAAGMSEESLSLNCCLCGAQVRVHLHAIADANGVVCPECREKPLSGQSGSSYPLATPAPALRACCTLQVDEPHAYG